MGKGKTTMEKKTTREAQVNDQQNISPGRFPGIIITL
jgi:hypothetical protein